MASAEYVDFDQQEVIELQLTFERGVWLNHKARDLRANHASAEAIELRGQAMQRIDGLLDKLFTFMQLPVDYGE